MKDTSHSVGITSGYFHKIWTPQLRWVSHLLTKEQKATHVKMATVELSMNKVL